MIKLTNQYQRIPWARAETEIDCILVTVYGFNEDFKTIYLDQFESISDASHRDHICVCLEYKDGERRKLKFTNPAELHWVIEIYTIEHRNIPVVFAENLMIYLESFYSNLLKVES